MSQKAVKVLVCGDVNGSLDELFKRVNKVIKSAGPFDSLFCVGEFFSSDDSQWNPYKLGSKKIPLPIYILGPKNESIGSKYFGDMEGYEICENLTYLGKSGVFTNASGLKVAYISGLEASGNIRKSKFLFIDDEIVSFLRPVIRADSYGVDLLITSQWPDSIAKFAAAPKETPKSSKSIAKAAFFLKPRYHFTSSDHFYERTPYRNHIVLQETAQQVTRFISLAPVGSSEKWLYAFSIEPMAFASRAEITKQPQDITENPYPPFTLEKNEAGDQFFYDMTASSEPDKKRRKREPAKLQQISQDDCWFCLASPKVEKQLVLSVGTTCYLALAKGALVPYHCLILPIAHQRCSAEIDAETKEELDKYKVALQKFFFSKGCFAVFFERNFKCSHLQVQCVPVPKKHVDHIKNTFLDYGASMNIELNEIPFRSEMSQVVEKDRAYFVAEFNNTKLLYNIRKGGFPLNFGREVLCCPELLDMEDRSDWKACSTSPETEAKWAQQFKKAFEPFDFTLEDDDDLSD